MSTIEVNRVAPQDRPRFLPENFGPRHMVRGEALVNGWMRKLSKDYDGGDWSYYTLSNGGFFMVPGTDGQRPMFVRCLNEFERSMSAEGAGIIATLYALGQLANETEEDFLILKFHALRDYGVRQHVEGALISSSVD